MTFFGMLETPVGTIGVESDGEAITRVTWMRVTPPAVPSRDPVLSEALRELTAYFAGDLRRFDVPVAIPARPDATNAVLSTITSFRFNPAELGGRRVKQLVQMPFQFSLSK